MALTVVGVGVARGQLTEEGRMVIEAADVVYGSRRALEIAGVEGRPMTSFGPQVYRAIEEEAEGREVVVLSTGDPMVCGLGTRMDGTVINGVSSVQMALSRLNMDLTDVIVVDAHGREAHEEIDEMLRHRHVLVLADRWFDVSPYEAHVILEDLGGEERMSSGEVRSDRAIVLVRRPSGQ